MRASVIQGFCFVEQRKRRNLRDSYYDKEQNENQNFPIVLVSFYSDIYWEMSVNWKCYIACFTYVLVAGWEMDSEFLPKACGLFSARAI